MKSRDTSSAGKHSTELAVTSGRIGIVLVMHSWGGGTERHVFEMAKALQCPTVSVCIMKFCRDPKTVVELSHFGENVSDRVRSYSIPDEISKIPEDLSALGMTHMHIHHVVGGGHSVSDCLRWIATEAKLQYDITIHDYYLICPRINLVDQRGIYCGEPSVQQCEKCVAANGSWLGQFSVGLWREQSARLLHGARKILCHLRMSPNVCIDIFQT